MTDDAQRITDRDRKILEAIRQSGAIDFDRLGRVIGQVSKDLFESGDDDEGGTKVLNIYENVIQVYEVSAPAQGLEDMDDLRRLGDDLRRE